MRLKPMGARMLDREPEMRRILKWAAGSPADVSDLNNVDEDRLLVLAANHHLERRLFSRLRRDKPRWGRRSLSTRAWVYCQRALEQMQRHSAALREITGACTKANQPPPILLKGFSLYALTGDSDHLRYSMDMDLLGEDPVQFLIVLRTLGYTEVVNTSLGPHEHAVIERDGVRVEVHSHFPVQSYPESVAPLDYIPEDHPGIWWQPEYQNNLPHAELTYQNLMDASTSGAAPEADGLMTLAPHMMALLLCAHTFRNIIEGHRFRLSEIADIQALVRHPAFDQRRFRDVVDEFNGQDAVHMTNHLGKCCLGVQLLPQETNREKWDTGQRLLQALGYWVGWRSFEEILLPLESGDLFARLGANAVTASTSGVPASYSVVGAGVGEPITRLIVPASQKRLLPFEFSITSAEEAITFDLLLPKALANSDQGYHIRFDDEYSTHIISSDIRDGGAKYTHPDQTSFHSLEEGYRLQVSIPWRLLPRPTAEGAIPLILSVVLDHFQGQQWLRADPSVRVPLLVRMA